MLPIPESTNPLAWALFYASKGWYVFPVEIKKPRTANGFNDASLDEGIITQWWNQWPDAGIGIATGQSGLVVLDVDNKGEGEGFKSLERLLRDKNNNEQLPQTLVSKTGGGGLHYFFKAPPNKEVKCSQALLGYTHIDVRAIGGYVVVPPSHHGSGRRYEWETMNFIGELAECPQFIVEGKKLRTISINFAGVQDHQSNASIPNGERNATLTRIAGGLRANGMDGQSILAALVHINRTRCNPQLDLSELQLIANSMQTNYPPFPTNRTAPITPAVAALTDYALTDAGMADRFALWHGLRVKHNHNTGQWLFWDGTAWQIDETAQIRNKVIEVTREWLTAVSTLTEEDDRSKQRKAALKAQDVHRIEACIKLAAAHGSIATLSKHWDKDPMLFGVGNGTYDFRTRTFKQSVSTDMISQKTEVIYDPLAKCPRWEQFILEIFNGDMELVNYIQRAIGYSLTGDISEQCLFLLVGEGANGKSIFLDILRYLLGQYAYTAPFSTFERSKTERTLSNDIAAMLGKRLVVASESNKGSTLDEALIKSITGGEPLSARFLHREFFTFRPACKIWLGVNHAPRVVDDSDGTWRRMRKIAMLRRFKGKDADLTLKDKLIAELPGILQWAIAGAHQWLEHGLTDTPKAIQEATDSYRSDNDVNGEFIHNWLVYAPDSHVSGTQLQAHYRQFHNQYKLRSSLAGQWADVQKRLPEWIEKVASPDGILYRHVALQQRVGGQATDEKGRVTSVSDGNFSIAIKYIKKESTTSLQ